MKRTISIVLPCLNEEKNLPLLIKDIKLHLPKKYEHEIICVDDGSGDKTHEVIRSLCSSDKRVKGIKFYRRFGHQAALRAGIERVSGDAVITMDSDFQHPPKTIPLLIQKWENGHDLVQARKKQDKSSSLFNKMGRAVGYFVWTKVSGGVLVPGVSDFRLMSRSLVDYVKEARESEMFLRGVVVLGAKKPATVGYRVGTRKHGRTSYSTRILVNMFLNGFVSFSSRPLRIAFLGGAALLVTTSVLLLYSLFSAFLLDKQIIEGWLTVVLLVLALNGFTILYIGVLGEYIGVIFREVKRRPTYFIEDSINL